MVALSIDTAANICAVALSDLRSKKILAAISDDITRGHAEILMDIIDRCMVQAGVSYKHINKIITTTGPGSFTGVRVGMSAARAIGLGLSKPVVGISNLQACASYASSTKNSLDDQQPISVILDARRDEVYFQQFQNTIALDQAIVCTLEDLVERDDITFCANSILCGSGVTKFMQMDATSNRRGDFEISHHAATAPIEIIAALGLAAPVAQSRPQPLYLRGADAKQQAGFAVPRININAENSAP